MSTKRCDVCGADLFEAVPFKTTQKEIVEFVQRSSFEETRKAQIIQGKWLHPGVYCPNSCTEILAEYGPPKLPELSKEQVISIAKAYSLSHHQEFIRTQGENSRIVACVHCSHFHGTMLEGESATARYRQPKHRPLRNHRVISAMCGEPRIMALKRAWWYDQGKTQPECDYFQPSHLFAWTYKDVTGWSEYPPE